MKRYVYKGINTPYLVSKNGDVFSEISGKFLKPFKNKKGYLYIDIHMRKYRIRKSIHSLVAETYIPNLENKETINHKDGNKENNSVGNLEWMTQSDNNLHSIRNKLRIPISGSKVHFAKYSENQVHQACRMIEENKFSLSEIEKTTGIPAKTLGEIRNKKIWKNISILYKFPEKFITSSKYFDYPTNVKIHEMLKSNKDINAIIDDLGLDKTSNIKKVIQDMKWNLNPDNTKMKKEIYNRYRSKMNLNKEIRSTTIEPLRCERNTPPM